MLSSSLSVTTILSCAQLASRRRLARCRRVVAAMGGFAMARAGDQLGCLSGPLAVLHACIRAYVHTCMHAYAHPMLQNPRVSSSGNDESR